LIFDRRVIIIVVAIVAEFVVVANHNVIATAFRVSTGILLRQMQIIQLKNNCVYVICKQFKANSNQLN